MSKKTYNMSKRFIDKPFQYYLKTRTPAEILVFGFFALIVVGAILLWLPISSANGKPTPFIDCIFTSTSSVCVTGLITVDTGTHWSVFGQMIIILLIQIGGLGFMTMMTIAFVLAGKRITIRNRMIIQSSVNSDRIEGIVKFVKYIVISALTIEIIGGILLSIVFVPDYGWLKGVYFGFWHSISQYCNAGFDLIGNFSSFTGYAENPLLSITVSALIVLGGLGFAVTSDLINFKSIRRLSVHTKIVVISTVVLILGGAILTLIFEYNNPDTIGNMPFSSKLLASFFQSITPRTAGSNTIDQNSLMPFTLFLTMVLMFIGGSPGSTAGGVKTTSFAVLFITLYSVLTGKEDVNCFRYQIPMETIKRAISVLLMGLLIVLFAFMILVVAEPWATGPDLLFEVFSAYDTVGLTRSITPYLSKISKTTLILCMFIGRVGPLTIAYMFTGKEHAERENIGEFHYPETNIMIG